MEKDIVIEQLRSEVQQLRLRVAVMEEEQAVAATPLQGLLTHLEELKVCITRHVMYRCAI